MKTTPTYEAIKKEAMDMMMYQSTNINLAVASVSGKYHITAVEAVKLLNDIRQSL